MRLLELPGFAAVERKGAEASAAAEAIAELRRKPQQTTIRHSALP